MFLWDPAICAFPNSRFWRTSYQGSERNPLLRSVTPQLIKPPVMDERNIRRFERATRVQTFGRDNAAEIGAGSKAAGLLLEPDFVVLELTAANVGQRRTPMGKPARTTRAIDLDEPGFAAFYRLPASPPSPRRATSRPTPTPCSPASKTPPPTTPRPSSRKKPPSAPNSSASSSPPTSSKTSAPTATPSMAKSSPTPPTTSKALKAPRASASSSSRAPRKSPASTP